MVPPSPRLLQKYGHLQAHRGSFPRLPGGLQHHPERPAQPPQPRVPSQDQLEQNVLRGGGTFSSGKFPFPEPACGGRVSLFQRRLYLSKSPMPLPHGLPLDWDTTGSPKEPREKHQRKSVPKKALSARFSLFPASSDFCNKGGATLFRPTGAFLPPPSVVTAARCGRFPYTRDTRKTDVPAGHKGFKKA